VLCLVEASVCTAAAIGSCSAVGSANALPKGVVDAGAKTAPGAADWDACACAFV